MKIFDVNLDASSGMWDVALKGSHRTARALYQEFGRTLEEQMTPAGRYILGQILSALNKLLGSLYSDEIAALAKYLRVSRGEVIAANVAYDLSHFGCTTLIRDIAGGPLHARNLDWPFAPGLLRKNTCVVCFRNAPAGDHASVTWPGLFGVLTGIAPGRFSVSVNHVISQDSNWRSVAARAIRGCWPVAWAVREVMDSAKSFDEAVVRLSNVSLIAPAIFSVAGVRKRQCVVIERTPDAFAVRESSKSALGATNHFSSRKLCRANAVDVEESVERLEDLHDFADAVTSATTAIRALSHEEFCYEDTQYQVAMRPRDGSLLVRIPGQKPRNLSLL